MVIAPPGSDVEEVIATVGNGAVFAGSQVDGMAEFLATLMQGVVPKSKRPEAYVWPCSIRQMDAMLRQAAHLPALPVAGGDSDLQNATGV